MFKKRRVVLGLLIAGIIGIVLGVLALLPARPGVTKANFDRIEIGMTRAEVEAIFGGPGGQTQFWSRLWECEDGVVWVNLDQDDCIKEKGWHEFPDDSTLWEKLLDCLPWHQKRPRGLMKIK